MAREETVESQETNPYREIVPPNLCGILFLRIVKSYVKPCCNTIIIGWRDSYLLLMLPQEGALMLHIADRTKLKWGGRRCVAK